MLTRDEDQELGSEEEVRFGGRGLAGEVHRVMQRYVGHANVVTDIKEATFLGADDQMVAVCSDDGHVFIYDAATGSPVHTPSPQKPQIPHVPLPLQR